VKRHPLVTGGKTSDIADGKGRSGEREREGEKGGGRERLGVRLYREQRDKLSEENRDLAEMGEVSGGYVRN